MEIEFLGTGTSHGIPVIGCHCPVCRSTDSRDTRYRSSILVKGSSGESIVVDAGPEFRLQAIRAGLERLDALLITHAHADHLHGLDDVRPFTVNRDLPVYGNRPTIEEMKERFSYAFRETQIGGGKPRLRPLIVESPFSVGKVSISPIKVLHGQLPIIGWLFEEGKERRAYLTDVSSIPEESANRLKGLDTLILGALRVRYHETHFSFQQALEATGSLAPKRAFLTHFCHEHAHREIQDIVGDGEGIAGCEVLPAYDGLVIP